MPVWDTVSPAAAKSVKLSVQHVSASVQVISRDLFHRAVLRFTDHLLRTLTSEGVREGGWGREGDACCLRANRGYGASGCRFQQDMRVHASNPLAAI